VFKRLTDRLFFESRFNEALRSADLPLLLEGNRVNETHGGDASYGRQVDVYLLRELYGELMPQALYYGKRDGKSPEDVALKFLCNLFDAYLEQDPNSKPDVFSFNVEMACWRSQIKLSEKWQRIVEEDIDKRRLEREELQGRIPDLIEARRQGAEMYDENLDLLQNGTFPMQGVQVWNALNHDFKTEYEIHKESGIPLEQLIEWMLPLKSLDLVVVIGTALDEPRYRLSPIAPKTKTAEAVKEGLDRARS
jgi:hypothetical protein